MWEAATQLGIPNGARVLEPGCGIGGFIAGARPGDQVTGVELDPTTAKIAALLHPNATVRAESFGDTHLTDRDDGYELAIGNVPFGQDQLVDHAYNRAGLSLHNAAIVKSLRLTKPGGIVMLMTSRWTLDSRQEKSRREIAKYGELLGAVRMPHGAHGETAGTDAVVDVLVLRRHLDAAPETTPDWVTTRNFTGTAGDAAMSAYFLDHPDMVLGAADTRSGRFGPETTVTTQDASPQAVAPQLERALTQIVAEANAAGLGYAGQGQRVTDRPVAVIRQDQTNTVGRVYKTETGEIMQHGVGRDLPVRLAAKYQQELVDLLALRDQAVALLTAEAATSEDTAEIAEHRHALNTAYDAYVARYGPLGRVTVQVKERADKEALIRRIYPAAIRALREDPHYATLIALEHFNEDTGVARKSTVFERRVVGVTKATARVETAADAVNVSLDRVGRVDVSVIAELLDTSETDALVQINGLVYLDPATATPEEHETWEANPQAAAAAATYVPAAEFLSGNVRQKLTQVRLLAQVDTRFEAHVVALESVVPPEIGPAEINVKLGAPWVPVQYVEQFIEETLEKPVKALEYIDGEWRFELRGKAPDTVEARWAITGDHVSMHAVALTKDVLNGKSLRLTYRLDKDSPTLVDEVATEAAQAKAAELHEEFADWLWRDAARTEELQTRYNDLYNGIVLRSYDGVELSFPGKAATFTPMPHQHAAVARMLAEPSVGLFHEVGAGKTAEMVLGVMELKRLGMVNKPAIVVPNHMLEQVTREFVQIYPQAKLLAAGSEDLKNVSGRDGRAQLVARAQSGDWDAVILTHSAFGKIGLGEAGAHYEEGQLAKMRAVHFAKLNSTLSEGSVKTLEMQIAKQEASLKQQWQIEWDQGVHWEDTGIDYICLDEAHLFKNLTVKSDVPDLAKPDGSQRATDLDRKLWYHREHLGQRRVATLATATPIANSIIEMYVMQHYLRPDLMRDALVETANDWARQFTEQKSVVEPKPQGGGFHVRVRTAGFRNLQQLLKMWHVAGDVKTAADLALPVPLISENLSGERAPEMVIVPPTAVQQAGMAELIERGEAVQARKVRPEEDNMLKITANGRALALDQRLLGYNAPDPGEVTKLTVVANNIYKIWRETKDNQYLDEWGDVSGTPGALQFVFADLGTPKDDGSFSAYAQLRALLTERGMPNEKIRFIHEATNDQAKAELLQACRDGRVNVLIGSTEKMGVGTNAQTRAAALHHVDTTWRPDGVVQRVGRAIRQGNQNSEVGIYCYSTEGSFDAYMWGLLARKAEQTEAVLSGRITANEIDNSSDLALQFAEMQAATLGDLRVLEIANLRQDTQKLTRQERAHRRGIDSISVRRKVAEQQQSVRTHDLDAIQAVLPKLADTTGDAFQATIKTSGDLGSLAPHRERSGFGVALRDRVSAEYRYASDALRPYHEQYPRPVRFEVQLGGVEWSTQMRYRSAAPRDPMFEFHIKDCIESGTVELPYSQIMGGDTKYLSRSFEHRLRSLPDKAAQLGVDSERAVLEIAEMRALEQAPWHGKEELQQKQRRLAELTLELEREAAAAVEAAEPAEPETSERLVAEPHPDATAAPTAVPASGQSWA